MPPKKRKSTGSSESVSKPSTKKAKTKKTADAPLEPPNATALPLRHANGKTKNTAIQISADSDEEPDSSVIKSNLIRPLANHFSSSRFYSTNNGNTASTPMQQSLTKIFDAYRGWLPPPPKLRLLTPSPDEPTTNPDKINITGAQKYLTDLCIELDEVVHLALCDLLSCPSIGEFEREGFISGWASASTSATNAKPLDTVSRQKAYVETLRIRLQNDPAYFKTIYRSAFKLAKPESQRSVPLDSALEFWRMFFSSSSGGIEWSTKSTPWLDLWLEYYETQGKRPVNKDLWNMVGELVVKTQEPGGETLQWWNEDGAWPMAVDEFVAWVKEKRKSGELTSLGGEDEMDTS
jgi:DCN1-like protein 1/2